MPGVPLNLDLPLVGDTMATIVAKLVAALSLVEDDLEAKVTPSEIEVNGSLSMNGSSLTNAGSVQFLTGNAPTAAGSLYYAAGEFYMIDSTGVIQITANGSLNAGSLGSIVGDYGGGNPALVSYSDALGEYQFTEDTGVWADLAADDLLLKSATGSVRFGVTNDITTDRSFLIKSLPTSGVSFLVYNSATSTVEDGSVTPATAMSIATLTVTNPIKHGDFTKVFPVLPAHMTGTYTMSALANHPYNLQLNTGSAAWSIGLPLQSGERIKTVRVLGSGTATVTVTTYIGLVSATTTGAIGATLNCADTTLSASDNVRVSIPVTTADLITGVEVTYDRVA